MEMGFLESICHIMTDTGLKDQGSLFSSIC